MQGRRPRGTEQAGTCEGGEGKGREGEPAGQSGAGKPLRHIGTFSSGDQDSRAHAASGARLGARRGRARPNGRGRGAPRGDGGARPGERLQAERYSRTAGDATGHYGDQWREGEEHQRETPPLGKYKTQTQGK